jgi:hypothetical protein
MTETTYSEEGPQCPHCNRQYTADEPFYYDERTYTEETCDQCGGKFSVDVEHRTSWHCEAILSQERSDG